MGGSVNMSELSTRELINQLTDKLIINLKEDEQLCPTCKGLRFILVERGNQAYIESCKDCHTGKVYVCKYCGKTSPTGHCDCEGTKQERIAEEDKKELERFNKAEKIKFKDYDGYFIFDDGHAIDKEDLAERIYELIYANEECPTYIYATTKDYVSINVDVVDQIRDNCADGYEDMDSYIDFSSDKLSEAQDLIDSWLEEQGERTAIYYEDYSRIVLLDELIEEIKNKIKSEDK
jgi:hypothetical protein